MKILWIVNNINQVGGIERVVINLSNYFTSCGLNVGISSLASKGGVPYFPIEEGVEIVHESYVLSDRISIFRAVYQVVGKSDADIVIGCHDAICNALVSCKLFFGKNKKIIVTQHCSCAFNTKKRNVLNSIFYRHADAFLVLTQSDKTEWRRFGIRNCSVMPNALVQYPSDTASLENNVIVSVGRLTGVKGYDFLIRAFAHFHKRHSDWKLRILGDGEEKETLQKLIFSLGLSEVVELTGFIKNVTDELVHSSVFALTSHSEGFSMALLEAMSCGLPIISVELPSVYEVLRQDAGIITAKDEIVFAEKLCELVENKNTMIQYGKKAIERSKCFSIEKIGDLWIELFENLMK